MASLVEKPVGTGRRHQAQHLEIVGRQYHAIWVYFVAVLIIATAAGLGIQIATSNIGVVQFTGLLILKFDYTATPAAVTKILPFTMAQRR
jgi:hypothetical protein